MEVLLGCCLIFLMVASLDCAQTKYPFYVIANMANSGPALDYAMKSGANAINVDLQFQSDGTPVNFEAGGFCDCFCSKNEMCSMGLYFSCSGQTARGSFKHQFLRILQYQDQISLIIIDSNIESKIVSAMQQAGERVIHLLEKLLLAPGYKGDIIISTESSDTYEYLRVASETAQKSKFNQQFYFAFDQLADDYALSTGLLAQIGTQKRVFGTGISGCLPETYYNGVEQAAQGRIQKQIGLSYIWTIDLEWSMNNYIDSGVQAIVTNNPKILRDLAEKRGLTLATPADHIPDSTDDFTRYDRSCDCTYQKGGCTISLPAPPYSRCVCNYLSNSGCRGSTTYCNTKVNLCMVPDGSLESCELGGGNCGGYA